MDDIKNLALRFKYGEEVSIDRNGNIYCEEKDEKSFFEGDLALFFAQNPQYKDSPYPLMHYKDIAVYTGLQTL